MKANKKSSNYEVFKNLFVEKQHSYRKYYMIHHCNGSKWGLGGIVTQATFPSPSPSILVPSPASHLTLSCQLSPQSSVWHHSSLTTWFWLTALLSTLFVPNAPALVQIFRSRISVPNFHPTNCHTLTDPEVLGWKWWVTLLRKNHTFFSKYEVSLYYLPQGQ